MKYAWVVALFLSQAAFADVLFEPSDSLIVDETGGYVGVSGTYDEITAEAASLPPGDYLVMTPDATLTVEEPPPPPQPGDSWSDSLLPYIPAIGEFAVLLETSADAVILPNDGTDECLHLKCSNADAFLTTWVGASLNQNTGVVRFVAGGGHDDLGANSVYDFNIGTLTWTRTHDYSPMNPPFPNFVDEDGDGYPDCTMPEHGPYAVHSYDGVLTIPDTDETLLIAGSGFTTGSQVYPCWQPESAAVVYVWNPADSRYTALDEPRMRFPKTAWDYERNVGYVSAQKPVDGLYEFNPDTMEFSYIGGNWNGKGGAMAFDDRYIYQSNRGTGLYRRHVSIDGVYGDWELLVGADDWPFGAGVAVSEGVVIGWDGDQKIYRYDTVSGQFSLTVGGGDIVPLSGAGKIYGKWWAIPDKPGVFIGISDTYGWVLYRAF